MKIYKFLKFGRIGLYKVTFGRRISRISVHEEGVSIFQQKNKTFFLLFLNFCSKAFFTIFWGTFVQIFLDQFWKVGISGFTPTPHLMSWFALFLFFENFLNFFVLTFV